MKIKLYLFYYVLWAIKERCCGYTAPSCVFINKTLGYGCRNRYQKFLDEEVPNQVGNWLYRKINKGMWLKNGEIITNVFFTRLRLLSNFLSMEFSK